MPADIQSTQNQRIKRAIKLRQRRGRDEQARFAIDGLREIGQALAGNIDVCEAFVCPPLATSATAAQLLQQLSRQGIQPSTVSTTVWGKLTFGQRNDGVLAIARQHNSVLADMKANSNRLVVVLEGLEKPGNVGAILRTADAAGVTAVILTEARTDVFNPNTIRASLGAVFRLPVVSTSNDEAIRWLAEQQITTRVARVDAAEPYAGVDWCGASAMVLGSEAHGVSAVWQDRQFTGIRLPMLGQVDSLNVASAAAVLMYEAVRQRNP